MISPFWSHPVLLVLSHRTDRRQQPLRFIIIMHTALSTPHGIGCNRTATALPFNLSSALRHASCPLARLGRYAAALAPNPAARNINHHRAIPVVHEMSQLADASSLLPVVAFFTPGLLTLLYAFIKGKGNLSDGLSRLLTEVSQVRI